MRALLVCLALAMVGCGPVGWCRVISVDCTPAGPQLYHTMSGLVEYYQPKPLYWATVRDAAGKVWRNVFLMEDEVWRWKRFGKLDVFMGRAREEKE